MNAEPAVINELRTQIRQHLLPQVASFTKFQSATGLQQFRNRLHSIHNFCLRAEMPDEISNQVEVLLSTSASFWHLITENEFILTNLKDFTRVRTFSAEAEGITNLEELLSGEDTLRDVIVNSIAFMLNWKANTIWVDSAKKARTAMTKNYMLEIQDRIWQFIKESKKQLEPIDIAQSEQIRERTEKFMQIIQVGELTTEAQVTLLMQIYNMLLRFQLGQLIIQLENLQENEDYGE